MRGKYLDKRKSRKEHSPTGNKPADRAIIDLQKQVKSFLKQMYLMV